MEGGKGWRLFCFSKYTLFDDSVSIIYSLKNLSPKNLNRRLAHSFLPSVLQWQRAIYGHFWPKDRYSCVLSILSIFVLPPAGENSFTHFSLTFLFIWNEY